jgi:hypothetical protein
VYSLDLGKRVVVKAWEDAQFKALLMVDSGQAMEAMGTATGPQVGMSYLWVKREGEGERERERERAYAAWY